MMNKEYLNKIHNIDKNYEKIISKSKEKNNVKNKILNMVAVLIVIILVGTTSTRIYAKRQWDIQFKEYENRQYSFASTAIENGYVENINMDYIYQNGIGVKVDSLVITDDHFESNISFKFSENMAVDSESFVFGYAVYDEENLYNFNNRLRIDGSKTKFDLNYLKFLYEEMNIDYNKKDIFAGQYADSCGITRVSAHDNNITSKIEIESIKGFPKSKKIYIRIFDLGYTMIEWKKDGGLSEAEEFTISGDSEWIFEINIPEQMYNRVTTALKLESEVPDFYLEKATITETKTVLKGIMKGLGDFIFAGKDSKDPNWSDSLNHKLYLTDSNGNEYFSYNFGTTGEEDGFHADFDVNKTILENSDIFLHIKVDEDEIVRKLITK